MSKKRATQLAKQMHKNELSTENGLVQQYRIIREDILKLRKDINHGYDMAKDAVGKKTILNELMKLKESL